jgi:hypothetical protein
MRQASGVHVVSLLLAASFLAGCSSGPPVAGDLARPGPPLPDPGTRAQDAPPEARADVEGGRPSGTDAWRITRPAQGAISAYTTAVSALPGDALEVKVSTTARAYRLEVYRLGAYDGGSSRLVHGPVRLEGREQPRAVLRPAATRTVVAPWTVDATIDTTGWDPGLHVVKLTTRARGLGLETQVPYVVSSPSAAGAVAIVAPVTTWQAYNQWGGYSLYHGPSGDTRSHVVSFDRPYSWSMGQPNDFRTSTVPAVLRAERMGVPLAYFTNIDLHLRPDALAGATAYVSTGHDEYWTTSMRAAVEDARDAGTNLAILGANTMYWRVRLEGGPSGEARTMVGYRSDAALDPVTGATSTARWRDAPVPRPEHELLGMQYECYPVDTDYVVVSPGWWGFRGTDVRAGDRIADLVGPEADRVYPDDRLPRPLQVLSDSPYSCGGVPTRAQSVYFTTDSGAAVFNAGTLRWVCALADRCERPLERRTVDFVSQVTDNVLRVFADGPAGHRRPARDNVDDFALAPVNAVPAS